MAGEGAEPSLRDPLPRDKWGQGLTVQLGPTWGQACAPSHDCVTPGERGHLCGGFIPSVGAVSTHMRGQPQGRPPPPRQHSCPLPAAWQKRSQRSPSPSLTRTGTWSHQPLPFEPSAPSPSGMFFPSCQELLPSPGSSLRCRNDLCCSWGCGEGGFPGAPVTSFPGNRALLPPFSLVAREPCPSPPSVPGPLEPVLLTCSLGRRQPPGGGSRAWMTPGLGWGGYWG